MSYNPILSAQNNVTEDAIDSFLINIKMLNEERLKKYFHIFVKSGSNTSLVHELINKVSIVVLVEYLQTKSKEELKVQLYDAIDNKPGNTILNDILIFNSYVKLSLENNY